MVSERGGPADFHYEKSGGVDGAEGCNKGQEGLRSGYRWIVQLESMQYVVVLMDLTSDVRGFCACRERVTGAGSRSSTVNGIARARQAALTSQAAHSTVCADDQTSSWRL